MNRIFISGSFALVLFVSGAFSQMLLHNVNSRGVQDGYTVQTSIDSLLIDTRMSSGVAISRYTLVMTPSALDETKATRVVGGIMDSIEMVMNFQLPSDFVADSMWLWVDGKAVPAYIQDRALASQQYTQIVGARRDPALLQTWGRGYYNLRIFPTSSLVSRKVMIEFRHTFDDDSAAAGSPLMTASIPIMYDSLYARTIYYSVMPKVKAIGQVTATFTADDRTTYQVELPGVGKGEAAPGKPLTISAESVVKLDAGTISADDPSEADELLWTGRISDNATAGLSFELSDATMRFENPPDTRIIIIDLRNDEWDWNEYYRKRAEALGRTYTPNARYEAVNIINRARKFAVLALQQYLKPGQKFNVLFGGSPVQMVFDAPVEASDENLEKAFLAVVAAEASAKSSTEDLLQEAANQAPDGLAVLISDLFQPPDYQVRIDTKYQISDAGTAYDSLMKHILEMAKESGLTLFTIEDNYQLYRVALESGGFRLSGILNRYAIAYHYEVKDGKRVAVPDLPPLFGSLNRSGMRDLTVTAEEMTDMSYTVDGYYNGVYYYYTGGIAVDAVERSETALVKMRLPNTTDMNSGFVRVAGKIDFDKTDKPVTVAVRGKTGGLWFSTEMTAVGFYPPEISSYRPYEDPQWAFRRAEQLAFDDYIGNAAAIEKIGREYHIVTRQTSLLALEPGMELWVDSSWQQEEQSNVARNGSAEGAVLSDASSNFATEGEAPTTTATTGSGVDLDGISLEDILSNKSAVITGGRAGLTRKFSVSAQGALLRITLPTDQPGEPVLVRVFNLKGRMVAESSIKSYAFKAGIYTWNMRQATGGMSCGMYMVNVTTGSHKRILRITLTDR